MTKKDLEQFLSIKEEIKQHEDQINLLEEQKTSIKSQMITDMPRGGTAKFLEDILIEIEEAVIEIAKKRAKLATLLLNIEKSIEELEVNERILIRYKYIHSMSFTRIEEKMNYSARHLRRMHADILGKIA